MPNDTGRELDADLGELDGPEPLNASIPVPTDWEPTTDDEMEADDA
ncbi:MAG: hypothetical protein KA973_14260 [Candidatus Microthrix sp.]|nr:hypothetical protein [Candidatus Microthrix sp.]